MRDTLPPTVAQSPALGSANTLRPPTPAEPFRVALLSFSDGRLRVHRTLEETIGRHRAVLAEAIGRDPLLRLLDEPAGTAHSTRLAAGLAREARRAGAEAAVFNVPVFAFPNFSAVAARVLEMPVLLSSPQDGRMPGLGGILAAHGALRQAGLPSRKIWGNPLEDASLGATLSAFCRATGAIERLKGSVFGLIGGRSIGMNTGVPCTAQWLKTFGVDVEHVDQLEIVRRARLVEQPEVDRAYAWLTARLESVATTGKAAPEHVHEQIRHYIALRGIVADLGLDFIGLKCHYDLSEYFVTGCLSAMLLNDPYDWDGPREPIMTACEADADGALTMRVLQLVSGFPSLLFDVRGYDREAGLYICCNCGAQPSWYAAWSDDAAENLGRVRLEPVIEKYAGGGAHFPYICRGGEITLARFSRVDGEYRLFVAKGGLVDQPREKTAATCPAWPHGFLRLGVEPRDFVERFNANHAHIVPGDHREALGIYGEAMGIPVDCVG
jgi:L-fucose isomerase